MNKKGFTLIELLAVCIILSILVAITIASVSSYIDSSRQASYEKTVDTIKIATETYLSETDNDTYLDYLKTPGAIFAIPLQELVDNKYLPSNMIDERTGDAIDLATNISITVVENNKLTIVFPAVS